MKNTEQYLLQLKKLAEKHGWRYGVLLRGPELWQRQLTSGLIRRQPGRIAQLGGSALGCVELIDVKQGRQLLGRECDWLICDMQAGFDANSFSAATGALTGGGVLIVLESEPCEKDGASRWLSRALDQLLVISPDSLPVLPDDFAGEPDEHHYEQQQQAVENIIRVVKGHRKRPLVLTADRGRGKTSAMGMASAELMKWQPMKILITAPAIKAVEPLFTHAVLLLPEASATRSEIRYGESSVQFIAPDELLRLTPECDLLLVDEASALPLPMLIEMAERYHRVVFSTTIHGYEGCGRGFTLKFQHWLDEHRPGRRYQHMDHPIRWRKGDPLEAWLYRTFILNYELEPFTGSYSAAQLQYSLIDRQQMLSDPGLLSRFFALLVNAHYQTSPNDLIQILNDEAIVIYAVRIGHQFVGCILAVREGELPAALIALIQRGERRPKGQLTPVTLANQLGIAQAAEEACFRIMRIAVHPQLQGRGIGSELLSSFSQSQQLRADYLSTSFGATAELAHFWRKNDFIPVKLGAQRDQASGCHSMLMLKGRQGWLAEANQRYLYNLSYSINNIFSDLETDIVKAIWPVIPGSCAAEPISLVYHYASGGSDYESTAPWIAQWLMSRNDLISLASDLIIAKVLQQRHWGACAQQFKFTGRKQVEARLRSDLQSLLANLQCKVGG